MFSTKIRGAPMLCPSGWTGDFQMRMAAHVGTSPAARSADGLNWLSGLGGRDEDSLGSFIVLHNSLLAL